MNPADFQPLDRDRPAIPAVKPTMLGAPAEPWNTVDHTPNRSDRSDTMLDAIAQLSVQRIPCRCYIGAQRCAVCEPSLAATLAHYRND